MPILFIFWSPFLWDFRTTLPLRQCSELNWIKDLEKKSSYCKNPKWIVSSTSTKTNEFLPQMVSKLQTTHLKISITENLLRSPSLFMLIKTSRCSSSEGSSMFSNAQQEFWLSLNVMYTKLYMFGSAMEHRIRS